MIEVIFLIVVVILWGCCVIGSLIFFTEDGISSIPAWALGAVAVVGLAFAITKSEEYEKQHPCVQYESRMTYNAATKTMMPMRVCIERGEWE